MTRLLVLLLVAAALLAVRAVLVPTQRLDGTVVVPVLVLAAAALAVLLRAERGAAR